MISDSQLSSISLCIHSAGSRDDDDCVSAGKIDYIFVKHRAHSAYSTF